MNEINQSQQMQNKLLSLVKLLDDDNEEIYKEVRLAFENYGLMLEKDLADLHLYIDDPKLSAIKDIIWRNRRTWLKIQWQSILKIDDEFLKLERVLELIAKFDFGLTYNPNLSERIKDLAYKFLRKNPDGNVLDLANFLFIEEGYEGATEDYYNPLNSNLDYVLSNKKGLPITLTLIYMLTAKVLGFRVEGCRFPGHFLAKAYVDNHFILIDCFNRGKIIGETEIKSLAEESLDSFIKIIIEKTTAKMIIIRILSNLYKAYEKLGEKENQNLFEDLALMH